MSDRGAWATIREECCAGIAQLVEHNLAKVGVAGSSPVSRSPVVRDDGGASALPFSFRVDPDGETGRREGLKIPCP